MTGSVLAQNNQMISFSGTAPSQPDGQTDLTFKLFDADNAGTFLGYTDAQTNVSFTGGSFSALLGSGSGGPVPAGIFASNPSVFISIELTSAPGTEIGPRVPIFASGYALFTQQAQSAQNAQNATNAQTAQTAQTAQSATTAQTCQVAQTAQTFNPGVAVTAGSSSPLLTLNNTSTVSGALGLKVTSSGGNRAVDVHSIDGAGVVSLSETDTGLSGFSNSATATNNIGVYGQSNGVRGVGVYGNATNAASVTTGVFGVASSPFGNGVLGTVASGAVSAGVKGTSSAANGNGVIGEANSGDNAFGVWGKSTTGFAGNFDGKLRVNGTTNLNGFTTVAGTLLAFAPADGLEGTSTGGGGSTAGVRGFSSSPNGNGVIGEANNGTQAYGVWGKSTTGFAGFFDGKVQVNGNLAARVVQITGADFSEKFAVRETETHTKPGMVMAIDPENPGKLVVSDKAYNRRVAGILSGAGGINPGMLMGQPGTLADGDQPVAMNGRVYVWADASNRPIAPGDLLTSSPVPGHAMKVTNYGKAQGATIGKAMTGLSEGRGLVLVLVALQ